MKIAGVVVAAAAKVIMSSTMVLGEGEDQADNLRGSGVTNSNINEGTSGRG